MSSTLPVYSVPVPFASDTFVEVYALDHMGSYEWRVVAGGVVLRDTVSASYGSAEVALRDALVEMIV